MHIEHDSAKMRFIAYHDDGTQMGYMAYSRPADGDMQVNSTKVYPEYEGQGIAARLLDELADYARANHYKVIPVCSYVVAAFARKPERYGDLAK